MQIGTDIQVYPGINYNNFGDPLTIHLTLGHSVKFCTFALRPNACKTRHKLHLGLSAK